MNQAPSIISALVGAPLPAAISLPGGAGCSASTLYQVNAAPGETVLTVGAGEEYQTIGAAVAAATDGDLILVQAGTYTNDFSTINAQVTIAGAGGLVNMVATEAPPNSKGFFVVNNNVQIDNVVFSGAAIPDSLGGNAAGIRYQGGAMVLHNDAFIGNQDGILACAVDNLSVNTVAIQNCTFDNNGDTSGPNAGYTHNCYISTGISTLTATGNVFERANVGHELKSRAETNIISGNIFYDGPTGTASYDIDLPNGGADTVSGNIIEKGPHASNSAMIHFGGEGIPYAGSSLSVIGNHFINDLGSAAIGVLNQTTGQITINGNEFDNFEHAQLGAGLFKQSGNVDENGHAIAGTNSGTLAGGTNLDDFSHDSNAHSITLTTSVGVLGGGGRLTVMAETGHVTVQGGSGGLVFQEAAGFGGSTITTASGATDTIAVSGQDAIQSAGQDSIIGGTGNLTAEIDGRAIVASGTGNNVYGIAGHASIMGSGGSDSVQVNAAGATAQVTGQEGFLQVVMNGGAATWSIMQAGAAEQASITGGASQTRIYQGTMNVTTTGAGAGSTISFGAGTAIVSSTGQDTIHAGSGIETVQVGGSAQVFGGSGTLSVYARQETGQASVYGAGGSIMIGGDTGDITYFGGNAANTVNAVLSNITVQGGAGLMNVLGGSRQNILGGSGGMVFATTGGADTITTAAGATDTITLAGASGVVSNGNDVIAAGYGNSTIIANGKATITGSTGNAFYTLNGADKLSAYGYTRATVGSGASDTVTAYGSLTAVSLTSGGTLSFCDAANQDQETMTVTGGNASIVCNAASNVTGVTVAGVGDGVVLGTGHESAAVQAAGIHVWAGSGADTVQLNQGGDIVTAGTGTTTIGIADYTDHVVTTILGGTGTTTINPSCGAITFVGGTGSAVIGSMSGGETVTAAAGNVTLLGGGGAATQFTAGSGSASVTLTPNGGTVTMGSGATNVVEASWGGADIYQFNAGHGGGSDTITGFRNGTDQLVLNGVTVTSDVSQNGSTLLGLSDGTHLTLQGTASFAMNLMHPVHG